MILNGTAIGKAIDQGEIIIKKSKFSDEHITEQVLTSADIQNSHKIRLQMGFLIRTLSDKKWLDPKCLFRNRDGIVDLRTLPNEIYALHPGEAIMFYTNEYVKLNNRFFGLIVSRVSNEDNGMVVSPSYIDPNWDGLLQLVLTNRSEKTLEIKMNCPIANLFFMRTEGEVVNSPSSTNDHFKITWQTIFEDPKYPKWANRERRTRQKIWHHLRSYIRVWGPVIGGALLLITTIIYNIINSFFK